MRYHNENFAGIYDFRCKYHDGWAVEMHLHEYSELLYCKKGCCEVTVNGCRMAVSEGHFLWLPPNYIHQYHSTDAQIICAVFSRDFIPLYFQFYGNRRTVPTPVPAGELGAVLERFPQMVAESPLRISGYLNLLCAKATESAPAVEYADTDSTLYQKVIHYLSAHFREEISLKSVAKHFGYNEKYLSHALHSLTGISFRRLLCYYRVEHAKKLLIEERSISRVAAESGFSALNSFNRVFKEMTGTTPSEYKKVYFLR